MGTAFYKVATLYVDVLFAYLGNTPRKRKFTYGKGGCPALPHSLVFLIHTSIAGKVRSYRRHQKYSIPFED